MYVPVSLNSTLYGWPFRKIQRDCYEALRDNQKLIQRAMVTRRALDMVNYIDSSSDCFPPVGTRVRRGPDWRYGNQDSGGPGTIIGHQEQSKYPV